VLVQHLKGMELVVQSLGPLLPCPQLNNGFANLSQFSVHLAQHFMHALELPGMGVATHLPDQSWQSFAECLAELGAFIPGLCHQLPVAEAR